MITLYLLGLICFQHLRAARARSMLLLAVAAKLAQVVPPQLQQGAYVVYQFFRRAVTYPLLFAIGVALTPWDKLMAAFALPNLLTIIATVVTLVTTGFFVGRWINLYPDRRCDRHRLSCRPGWHRRCGDPDGGQPHAAHAVCPDRHAHRRRDHHHPDVAAASAPG